MSRLWVVEAQFIDGTWDICMFGCGEYTSSNYFNAHKMKRKQQAYLQECNKHWYKNKFRVREYIPKDEVMR